MYVTTSLYPSCCYAVHSALVQDSTCNKGVQHLDVVIVVDRLAAQGGEGGQWPAVAGRSSQGRTAHSATAARQGGVGFTRLTGGAAVGCGSVCGSP